MDFVSTSLFARGEVHERRGGFYNDRFVAFAQMELKIRLGGLGNANRYIAHGGFESLNRDRNLIDTSGHVRQPVFTGIP